MDLSDREKSIWIELIVSITVSIYYFSHVIGIDGFMDITNIAFGKVIINSILFSIVAAILLAAIFRHKNNERKDERDIAISTRGIMFAVYTLKVILILIIGHIMLNEGVGYFAPLRAIEISTSQMVHMIVIAILAADTVKSVVQIFSYRRGF